ncbi:hypothetical protein L0664_16520 [Octadecabacter sp. G9-8]|uniref:MarR family transcriptional regulator n=1 Tax=Octadecabacter dasysiphoniae TaxID=2909341 RepID=A0ABS9CZK4_9RHOB|nr:hypothetical protein [Octadecabacter dasysiphoniae]MCF2872678.1 hypothetical protein [Octadecabacter dasysiphoniae]
MSKLIESVRANLSVGIDAIVVDDMLTSYQELVAKHRAGDYETALVKAGRFVEHTLRSLEYLRTGKVPTEIKSVATTSKSLENATSLSESARMLIPRALYGMVYNIRSKRNAVHVKEIDPSEIDVAMSVAAASWVLAELLRIYHSADETVVSQAMSALTRTSIPFIETIDGETFVGHAVDPKTELLLLLAHAGTSGMSRLELGRSAKLLAPAVTRAIQQLCSERLAHQSDSKRYFITTGGETHLANSLAM